MNRVMSALITTIACIQRRLIDGLPPHRLLPAYCILIANALQYRNLCDYNTLLYEQKLEGGNSSQIQK